MPSWRPRGGQRLIEADASQISGRRIPEREDLPTWRNEKQTRMTKNAITEEIVDSIGFHLASIEDGITRIVNGLEDGDHAKSPSRKEVGENSSASPYRMWRNPRLCLGIAPATDSSSPDEHLDVWFDKDLLIV
jgi:hypothetical protein